MAERVPQARGIFITFEGIEGSGKSTQIKLLAGHLASVGRAAIVTREPGGTLVGDRIRSILLDPSHRGLDASAELLLYAASRAQHLREIIVPALEAGRAVLCDRFSDATIAYQGCGRGIDRRIIQELDRIVTGGIKPEVTILLDLDAQEGLARARGRNAKTGLECESRFECEDMAFHARVRDGYLDLAAAEPGRFRVVNAARPAGDIQEEVRRIVFAALDPAARLRRRTSQA